MSLDFSIRMKREKKIGRKLGVIKSWGDNVKDKEKETRGEWKRQRLGKRVALE